MEVDAVAHRFDDLIRDPREQRIGLGSLGALDSICHHESGCHARSVETTQLRPGQTVAVPRSRGRRWALVRG